MFVSVGNICDGCRQPIDKCVCAVTGRQIIERAIETCIRAGIRLPKGSTNGEHVSGRKDGE